MDSVVCQPSEYTCPDAVFLSNKVFLHPACRMNAQTSKNPPPPGYSVTMSNQSTITVPVPTEEPASCGPACIGIAVAVPIVLILLGVVIVLFVIKRRTAASGGQKKPLPNVLQRFQKSDKQEGTHIQLENEEQKKKLLDGKEKKQDMKNTDDLNPFLDDMIDEDNEDGGPWDLFLKSLNLKVDKLYKPPSAENLGTRLRSLEAMSIVGKWGSGRSTLAKQAILECALNFVNSTCKFTTIDRVTDWTKGVHDDCVSFIHVPDCIKEWYSPSHVEDLAKSLTNLFAESRGKCFVILGLRDIVWEKYKHVLSQCEIFKEARLNFMQDKENLSSKDYREMLHKQLHANNAIVDVSENIPVDDKSKKATLGSKNAELLVAKENSVIGLPELAAISSKNRRILINVARFCAEPLSIIKDDLKQMSESPKISEKHKFVVLTYAMIHNGSFSLQRLNQSMLRSIRTIFAVFSPPDDYFEEAVDKLMEEYLEISTDKETHYIQHEIITRILFEIVAESKMEFLIQNCDSRLLLNCIRPATFSFSSIFGKLNKELVVGIEPNHHQALCERFKQIESGGEKEARKHVIMEDAAFQRLML